MPSEPTCGLPQSGPTTSTKRRVSAEANFANAKGIGSSQLKNASRAVPNLARHTWTIACQREHHGKPKAFLDGRGSAAGNVRRERRCRKSIALLKARVL